MERPKNPAYTIPTWGVGNYSAGSDPWSGTPKRVAPIANFFTPGPGNAAQYFNDIVATDREIESTAKQLITNVVEFVGQAQAIDFKRGADPFASSQVAGAFGVCETIGVMYAAFGTAIKISFDGGETWGDTATHTGSFTGNYSAGAATKDGVFLGVCSGSTLPEYHYGNLLQSVAQTSAPWVIAQIPYFVGVDDNTGAIWVVCCNGTTIQAFRYLSAVWTTFNYSGTPLTSFQLDTATLKDRCIVTPAGELWIVTGSASSSGSFDVIASNGTNLTTYSRSFPSAYFPGNISSVTVTLNKTVAVRDPSIPEGQAPANSDYSNKLLITFSRALMGAESTCIMETSDGGIIANSGVAGYFKNILNTVAGSNPMSGYRITQACKRGDLIIGTVAKGSPVVYYWVYSTDNGATWFKGPSYGGGSTATMFRGTILATLGGFVYGKYATTTNAYVYRSPMLGRGAGLTTPAMGVQLYP